jgi:hypothetical protein
VGATRILGAPVKAAAALGFVLFGLVASSAQADFVTFGPVGAEQQFTVPAGVTSIRVTAVGGKGGGGIGTTGDTGTGGFGAIVTSDLGVTPGQVLYVEVGGNGADPTLSMSAMGGFNGGATGGAGTMLRGGGGGGGATDLRTLPRSVAGSLTSRLIIAGGGGGGGGWAGPGTCGTCTFNAAGGAAGAGGTAGAAAAGGGATPTQPGSATSPAQPGTLGAGGTGAAPTSPGGGGGGGGGGGAYGGGGGNTPADGGGAAGSGGGGGSSTFPLGATNTAVEIDSTGIAGLTIVFTPGGGGPTGPAGPEPPAAPARPKLSSSPSAVTVSRKRLFAFSFRGTPGLEGKAVFVSARKLKVGAKKKSVTFATKRFSVPQSGKVKLKLKLSKTAFELLKRAHRISTRARVTLRGPTGLSSSATKTIKLRAP